MEVKTIYNVMVKKIRRKVKKVAMKASLVSMELEDLTEENEEHKKTLSEDFKNEFAFIEWKRQQEIEKKKAESSQQQQETEQSTESESTEESNSSDPEPPQEECEETIIEQKSKPSNIPSELKKLYRSIAQLTHPDKVQDERLNDIFRQAAEAMTDENWMLLVELAAELHIDIEFLSDETCEIIEKSIVHNQNKIAGIKNSFSYIWSKQKDGNSKDIFKKMFYQQFRINQEEFENWLKARNPSPQPSSEEPSSS